MRKWIAIMMMVLVIFGFMASVSKRDVGNSSKEIEKMLKDIQQKIDENYPDEPIDIITLHSKLMEISYGKLIPEKDKKISEKDIRKAKEQMKQIVELQRKLYSNELLALNTEEVQLEKLEEEVEKNKGTGLRLVGSEVVKAYYDKSDTIIIEVIHYTNQQNIARQYILLKDSNSDWKIYRWNAKGADKVQEEKQ